MIYYNITYSPDFKQNSFLHFIHETNTKIMWLSLCRRIKVSLPTNIYISRRRRVIFFLSDKNWWERWKEKQERQREIYLVFWGGERERPTFPWWSLSCKRCGNLQRPSVLGQSKGTGSLDHFPWLPRTCSDRELLTWNVLFR